MSAIITTSFLVVSCIGSAIPKKQFLPVAKMCMNIAKIAVKNPAEIKIIRLFRFVR